MNDFCFSNYYKIMKDNLKNYTKSDPDFMVELFEIITKSCGSDYATSLYDQKGTVSRICHRSLDVPEKVKELLDKPSITDIVYKSMDIFLKRYYFSNIYDYIKNSLVELFSKNKLITDAGKRNIINDNDFTSFMTKVYLEALRVPNKLVDATFEVETNGNTVINYTFSNIFKLLAKKRKAVVIPVETSFEVKLESPSDCLFPLVDINTIHGQWVKMMLDSNMSEETLKQKIQNGIYEEKGIGCISIVSHEGNVYYLVSLSQFDKRNVAHSTRDYLTKALEQVLDAYDFNGQGYELLIPLMGTGKSRIGLSHEESFYLIESFMINNIKRISGKIKIVIYDCDIDKINI